MKEKFIVLSLAIVLSVVAGVPCQYFKDVIRTKEMNSYSEYYQSLDFRKGISTSEFEELKKRDESYVESIGKYNFGLKDFFVGFILNPLIVIALAGLWYCLGFRLSSIHLATKLVISLVVFLSMLYFGYVYQPYVHILAFVAGQFRWLPIAYLSRSNPDRRL